MTITRIWQTGWELGVTLDEADGGSALVVSTTPNTGTYTLQHTSTLNRYKLIGADIAQARTSFHFRHNGSTGSPEIVSFLAGATNIIRVQYSPNNEEWNIVCGSTTVATVADSTMAVLNTYRHIGVDVKVDASAGWVYVYRDGTEIVAYDGKTDHGGATFNRFHMGRVQSSWASAAYMDDIYLDNSTGEGAPAALDDAIFPMIRPDDNGAYADWVGSDADSTDNYLLVDETPPDDDVTYITTATATDQDSHALGDYTIPAGYEIVAAIPVAVAKKVDAGGTLDLKVGTRAGGSDAIGSAQTLGTDYTLFWERQTTKPAGGAWDQTAVSGAEVVVEAAA